MICGGGEEDTRQADTLVSFESKYSCNLLLGYSAAAETSTQRRVCCVNLCDWKHWLGNLHEIMINKTYSDMTSGGKLRGISPALSHNALSLVHVHDAGQRGCLALLLSTTSKTDATTSTQSQHDLLGILRVFSMLANLCRHDLRVEEPYT